MEKKKQNNPNQDQIRRLIEGEWRWVDPIVLTPQQTAGVIFEKILREEHNNYDHRFQNYGIERLRALGEIYAYHRKDNVMFAKFILCTNGTVLPTRWFDEEDQNTINNLNRSLETYFGIKMIPGDDAGEIPEIAFLRRIGELANLVLPPIEETSKK